MAPLAGDAIRGHLDAMLLALLDEKPAHGFELVKRLEASGDGVLRLKEGTVYPALYRLEGAGWVKAEWDTEDDGRRGPRRRVYSLTRSGRKRLDAQRGEWGRFVRVVGGILGVES